MDSNAPPGTAGPYQWMRQTPWNTLPPADFPTARGPVVYEGYVPQPGQLPSSYTANTPHQPHLSQNFSSTVASFAYPHLDQEEGLSQHNGSPLRFYNTYPSQEPPSLRLASDVDLSSRQYAQPQEEGAMSINAAANPDDADTISTPRDSESNSKRGQGRGRGRGRPRGRPRGSGGGRGGRGSRKEGPRGGWSKGIKLGLRAVLDPGEEFNVLHKDANEAFIEQDYDKARKLILEAISVNPEIYSAHVLLSEICFACDDDEKAVAALFSGAHAVPNDPAVWHQLAEVCLQRASLDRVTMLKQASYCFQRLLQIDQNDHDARFQKAAISRELGHHAKALKDFGLLLQQMPHNSSILRQIAEVCLDINDVGRAIGLYDDALEYQKLGGIVDENTFSWADLIVYVDLVARPDGAVPYAISTLKKIARQLLGRADESFWDNVTTNDCEWDAEDGPRRIGVPGFQPGRHAVEMYGSGLRLELRVKLGDLRLKNGDRDEAMSHFEWLAPDDHSEGSPIYEYSDLFLHVADILREIKEYQHALRYYEALYSINACDDVDFWLGLGACSYMCEKREQALVCYEEAKVIDPASGEARTQLSKLYAEKGERDKALLLARSAMTIYASQVPRTERRKYERKDLREAREAAEKAYKDAYRIPKSTDGDDDLPKPYFSRRAREKIRLLAKQAAAKIGATGDEDNDLQTQRGASLTPPRRDDGLRSREAAVKQMRKGRTKKNRTAEDRIDNIQQLYSTLNSVTEAMRSGNDVARNVWMDCAEALVDEFRTAKIFYPGERYKQFLGYDRPWYKRGAQDDDLDLQQDIGVDVPLPSVESTLPSEYCGIVFTNWLDVFLEYAMLLANMQEDTTDCYTVIRAALDCNVWFHDKQAMFQIHTCWLACALALRDETTLFNTVLRWFMREFMFCTDTFRLFAAFNFYFPHATDKGGKTGQMNTAAFRTGPNQKYLLRQIAAIDSSLPADYGSDQPDGPVPEFMRKPIDSLYVSDKQRRESFFDSSVRPGTADVEDDQNPGHGISAPQGEDNTTRTFTPKELDVVLLILYGQALYAGGSFPNALSYYYRAYVLEPENPILLLSIALCYMHQMFKRQNENRHMYLLQGWSFFEKYTDTRLEWARKKEAEGMNGTVVTIKREIEFNRGRCWQMLGMSDLAIRSYGRMLDIKAMKTEDEMDVDAGVDVGINMGVGGDIGKASNEIYSMEAAYAMVIMYALNGDIDKAREITEQYLVVV